MPYEPNKIESYWQDRWEKEGAFKAEDFGKKPKFYALIEFPYPSGAGLHVGHPRGYTAIDVVARKKRLEGYNVMFPIGWDAFGLPTENYAIKNGIHPSVATKENIANFKKQIKSFGFSFDWDREINTTDPEYYKWTQWIFLKLFEKGLAYQAKIPINWCPSCKIGLANEEAVGGKCERCGATVEQKEIKQWLLRITKYADRLIDDLKNVDYLEKIKTQQINWIGRSEGTEVEFKIQNSKGKIESQNLKSIKVFTTRIDTIFGVTALVLAPENPLVKELVKEENKKEVEKYIEESNKKTEFERIEMGKEKTGVFIGSYCINPLNNEEVPIWVGDYVVASYGGGAVMVVPAHDWRDWDFAKKYGISIKEVVKNPASAESSGVAKEAFTDYGELINSGEFDGLESKEAIKKITEWLEKNNLGEKTIHYKLRDWIFSRQHYWGEPIPIIHCEACKNKKYRYLLLHGRHGSSQRDFFPWLKKKLESHGHEVFAPDMPDTENPKVEEQADFVIKNFKIDSDTIILGHSLGGAVTLNILEKINKKIAKVILVDSVLYPKFNDKPRPDLEKNFHWKFNFEKIKKSADEFIDLADQNFPIITKEQFEDKNKLLCTRLLYVKPNANHFNSAVEPLVLEYAQNDGIYPVSEKDLPVELPFVEKYQPTGTGESPLAAISDWVNVKCPKCGGLAKRETDTMPNWAGSSWYFMRYCDVKNDKALADKKKLEYWMPVNWYNGGFEHTTLHLLYSRFWYKFLYDIGVAPTPEPYQKRTSNGVILAEDGRKMSKSFGNVVNPDDIIKEFGADSLRLYEMFMGPFDQAIAWSTNGLKGCYRFLLGLWDFVETNKDKKQETEKEGQAILNKTIKKVSEDIEAVRFNTAVSALMELMNYFKSSQKIAKDDLKKIIKLVAPFVPHLAEELWQKMGNKKSIFEEKWPEYDESLIREEIVKIAIQINGKLRDTLEAKAGLAEDEAKKLAISQKKIENWVAGKEIKKVIFVPDKIINIVI